MHKCGHCPSGLLLTGDEFAAQVCFRCAVRERDEANREIAELRLKVDSLKRGIVGSIAAAREESARWQREVEALNSSLRDASQFNERLTSELAIRNAIGGDPAIAALRSIAAKLDTGLAFNRDPVEQIHAAQAIAKRALGLTHLPAEEGEAESP